MSVSNMRNCPKCGKVFTYMRSNICPKCVEAEEVEFEKVRIFIKESPDKNLEEVSAETGVSPKKILRFIREGRLEVCGSLKSEIKCEKCGCSISKGRYCDTCALQMDDSVKALFGRQSLLNSARGTEKKSSGMHSSVNKK